MAIAVIIAIFDNQGYHDYLGYLSYQDPTGSLRGSNRACMAGFCCKTLKYGISVTIPSHATFEDPKIMDYTFGDKKLEN